ncbi:MULTISPECIES: ABC transporter permease [unclassified Staphylococcus]|uniref:ABC transporter permease n=1 Tax=unclassified Staphylococcus TaxID=91994 RepID=UPI0021D3BE83|nr:MULTISPECIES: ABC transporter permease [unclassified Staphylococcus]UXR78716.1 ABC transporter permease [Staphylococcus sp. IVB6227]UXR82875.1 ABC transporter permease [Staphylococcus sp. IVB6214]
MRAFAIAKKVFKELIRDKRTLALMFVAPIFIMWLMNVMFTANNTTEVNMAVVGVDQNIVSTMDDVKHVSAKNYERIDAAEKALSKEKVDAIVSTDDNENFSIIYANRDASKTAMSKQVFKQAVTSSQVKEMTKNVQALVKASPNPKASDQLQKPSISLDEYYDYGDEDSGFFIKMIPVLMGFMVFFFVFLISGMALLKERTSGTLDRLLATPVRRADIVFGYMLSYGFLAIIQTLVIVIATINLLKIEVVGSIAYVVLVNFVLAMVALAFGILMSTLAKSEFQMMQFIPLVVMPQLFFSGLIPLENMANWVQVIGKILPLSYSGHALSQIILWGNGWNEIIGDLGILMLFLIVLTALNIIVLKRYRKV